MYSINISLTVWFFFFFIFPDSKKVFITKSKRVVKVLAKKMLRSWNNHTFSGELLKWFCMVSTGRITLTVLEELLCKGEVCLYLRAFLTCPHIWKILLDIKFWILSFLPLMIWKPYSLIVAMIAVEKSSDNLIFVPLYLICSSL